MHVNLGNSVYTRTGPDLPSVELKNYVYEKTPSGSQAGDSLIARECTEEFTTVGSGPIRAMFQSPGAFSGDIFVVSDDTLYRVDSTGAKTAISGTVYGTGNVSMGVQQGTDYTHLFVSDETKLQLYKGEGQAYSTLTLDGTGKTSTLGTTVINIGGIYYTWTDADSIDEDDSSDGTEANPYLLLEADTDAATLKRLAQAINYTGTSGTDYTTQIEEARDDVEVNDSDHYTDLTSNSLIVRAVDAGTAGNSIVSTLTGGLSKGSSTLSLSTGDGSGFTFGSCVIQIGTVYYKFATAAKVAADTKSGGTAGRPYKVWWGNSDSDALENLGKALMGAGTAGTTYTARIPTNGSTTVITNLDKEDSTDLTDTSLTIHGRQNITDSNTPTVVTGGYQRASGSMSVADGSGHTITKGLRVNINGTRYMWVASKHVENDVGNEGSKDNPWSILIGETDAESLYNLALAINCDGADYGTIYNADTEPNEDVMVAMPDGVTATTITFWAIEGGVDGNDITLDTDTGMTLSGDTLTGGADTQVIAFDSATLTGGGTSILTWSGDTLEHGGEHYLSEVEMDYSDTIYDNIDDDDKDLSLSGNDIYLNKIAVFDEYILISEKDSGKFYFIPPGEWYINSLNYATAESAPDNLIDIKAAGDTVFMIGEASIEAWYGTGDSDDPFAPNQGRTVPIGAVDGTVAVVEDVICFVGNDGRVYSLSGQLSRISDNGIEERVQQALAED